MTSIAKELGVTNPFMGDVMDRVTASFGNLFDLVPVVTPKAALLAQTA
jgi:hypothetical protein